MPQTNKPQRHGSRVHAVTDWNNPRAFALCDGCKMLTYRDALQMQMDYRGGMSPVPTGFLVCPKCYDTPNAQFMLQVFKPDPVPTYLPRPDDVDLGTLKVTATPVTLLPVTSIALVNVAAPTTVNLWASPANFDNVLVEDTSGAALTNHITILPAAGLINSAASYVIAANYGAAHLVYQSGQWNAT